MRKLLLIIVVVLLILLAIVVGSRNTDIITINYLIAKVEMRVSTFMVIALTIGFILGFASIFSKYLSTKLKLALLNRKLAKFKQEV